MSVAPQGDLLSASNGSGKAEVLRYLDCLIAHPAFASSPRRCQLLRYLVERKLAGDAEKINEYAIALDVFEKPTSFDPRSEAVVRVQVSRLRRSLSEYYAGEGMADPWRIELPTRGYVAAIERAAPLKPVAPLPETAAAQSPSQIRDRRATFVAIAVLAVTVAGGIGIWAKAHSGAHRLRSLAVIPFVNLSTDHANDYFSEGLTDEVTASLGRIRDLRVIARASTMKFRGGTQPPQEIGKQLGVETVLSGSVQRERDRVRVIAQFASTADGLQIWSDTFDGDSLDALGLEDRIATAVAAKFGAPPPHGPAVRNPAVHDLYLRGHFFAVQNTPASIERAAELFRQGLERDPNDPECLRGLAQSEVYMANTGQRSAAEANRVARPLIEKAVAADPTDGMGHLMLGYMLWVEDRNWQRAETEYRKAVELSPSSPDVRNNYGYALMYRGRFDEAEVQFVRGKEIDPLNVMPHFNMCGLYYYMGDYPHAEAECRTVLRTNPKFLLARVLLANVLSLQEKYDVAFQELEKAQSTMLSPDVALAFKTIFLARQGKLAEARRTLGKIQPVSDPVALVSKATAYLTCGDRDEAYRYLDRAYREHDGDIFTVPFDPAWAAARSEPRFRDLFRRINGD